MQQLQVLTESENSLSRGKKFYVALFDFLSMFLACVLLFVCFIAIFQSSDGYKNITESISAAEKALADACVETKLTKYETSDNGTSLASMERIAVDYVKAQAYARFVANGDERATDKIFANVVQITAETDPCLYYIDVYKVAHKSDYSTVNADLTVEHYTETLRKTECFDESEYPLLTTESAEAVYAYLKNSNASDKVFADVKTAYSSIVEECVGDFMNNSNAYAAKQQTYGDASERLYKTYIYALLIVYVLSMTVFYLVLPLALKDGQTLFMRLFRLRCVNYDTQNIGAGQVVVRFVCQLLLNLFVPLFILLLSMDISTFSVVIFVRFLRFFNLFAVGTLALVLTACNMIFTFYSKKKKQTLAEFIAKIITVEDKRVKTVNLGGIEVEVK